MDSERATQAAPEPEAPPRPDIGFSVTAAGPEAVDLVVRFGPRDYPVRLSPAEATDLGLALIATASVATDRDHPVAPGTRVENCFFPVLRWTAGNLAPGRPALALTVAENTEIAFQFSQEAAIRCGRDLMRSGMRPFRQRLRRAWTALGPRWRSLASR
ncbi:hypothetical protein [Methylobacterium sp. ID0610]|uniref:hypothetical protein n=1 Tax=Methylobacterium carpenticola TaxID=3344827 RepID=UPI00369CD908